MENTLLSDVQSQLTTHFGDAIISAEQHYDFPVFVVKREKIMEILSFLKNNPEMGFDFLTTLCGIHFPENKGKELCVMYQLHNLPKNLRIRLKIFFGINDAIVPTATTIWPTANWMERETYDFFGVVFKGHPNLKRILNMDEMNYFPLRKEYGLEDNAREDKNDAMFGR